MGYAVIRIRGSINVKGDIKDTLNMLRLNRANHCVILPEEPAYKGMIQKVKDYVTWGEISEDITARLLFLRGKTEGDQPISEGFVRQNTDYDSIEELSKAICKGDIRMSDIKGLKPVFRLHPPTGGYRTVKRAYTVGGSLGYRGKDINSLLEKMMEERGNNDVEKE